MAKIRLMHVVHSLEIGGIERSTHDMVEVMPSYDIEPSVCCLDRLGPWGEDLKNKGFKIYTIGRSAGIDFKLISKLKAIIKEYKPDVIHPHQYTPYFYTILSNISLYRPKIVFSEHGRFYPDRMSPRRVMFNQFANRLTDRIISVCEATKKALVKYEWFPANKIEVIYNGIKIEKFQIKIDIAEKRRSLGLKEDDIVIGAVGRLCTEKNYKMLILAFGLVAKDVHNAKLVIVGGGQLEDQLRQTAADMGLTNKVLFLGPRTDVPEILKTFDIYALSSDSEGASQVLLEAMASGTPVVATNVGGNPEIILDGQTGILVPRGDQFKFAEAILNIANDLQYRGKMAENGRNRIFEKFTFTQMVENYVNTYKRALDINRY
jgi:L-malate glycosyltransferase